jgi:hypothetical protein
VRVGLEITLEYPAADIDAFTDRLMDELLELNDAADVGGSVKTGLFDVWVTVSAASPLESLQLGVLTIKTAVHAAGGGTRSLRVPRDWPDWIHEVSLAADPVDVSACV